MAESVAETEREASALAEFREEIDQIDTHEKASYLKALQVAPRLVEIEGTPLQFLRFTNYNAAAAARGVVNYWQRRHETFQEKAFLPMTICGNGALSAEAIDLWKFATSAQLPNDSSGCSVICCDSSRRPEASDEARVQVAWYNGELISRNPRSQTQGGVVLFLVKEFRIDSVDRSNMQTFRNLFPVRAKASHIFNCIPTRKRNCLLQSFLSGLERMWRHLYGNAQHHFHTSQQKQEYAETMEAHGISRTGLPKILGGRWSYKSYPAVVEKIFQEEQERYADCYPSPMSNVRKPEAISPCQDGSVSSYGWKYLMERALDTSVPAQDKQAYLEAKASATHPSVWLEESNFDWFLEVEDFSPLHAARRLARYWQLRNETFSAELRFQPMHQTGEGALGRRELRVLGTRFLELLPNDGDGRPVLSIDSSRLKDRRSMPDETVNMCLFYMFSLLAESEMGRSHGAVILYQVDPSARTQRVSFHYLARLADSLPLYLAAFHFLSRSQVSASLESSAKSLCDEVVAHDGGPLEEIALSLREFRLVGSSLPKSIGGEWGLSMFIQWQELRTRTEFRVPLGNSARKTGDLPLFPGLKEYTELSASGDEKAERQRRLNVVYCRRKRDLKRICAELLNDECADLNLEHGRLLDEHARLTELVDRANTEVSRIATQPLQPPVGSIGMETAAILHGQQQLPVQDGTSNETSTRASSPFSAAIAGLLEFSGHSSSEDINRL